MALVIALALMAICFQPPRRTLVLHRIAWKGSLWIFGQVPRSLSLLRFFFGVSSSSESCFHGEGWRFWIYLSG
jgi:hypothetical protein